MTLEGEDNNHFSDRREAGMFDRRLEALKAADISFGLPIATNFKVPALISRGLCQPQRSLHKTVLVSQRSHSAQLIIHESWYTYKADVKCLYGLIAIPMAWATNGIVYGTSGVEVLGARCTEVQD